VDAFHPTFRLIATGTALCLNSFHFRQGFIIDFRVNPQVDSGKRVLDDRILSLNLRTKTIHPMSVRLTPATFRQPPAVNQL
jgi:hypothetical protein